LVKLHENDLQQKGLKSHGLHLKNVNDFVLEKKSIEKARVLLEQKSALKQWGWKEPRSTLYLQSWKKLIPNLKVVAVFRPYHQVVRSLVNRTIYSFLKTDKYSLKSRLLHLSVFPVYLYEEKKKYLDAWVRYNRSILAFKNKYPDDILIIPLNTLINKDEIIIDKINAKFGIDLNYVPIKNVFEQNLMSSTSGKVILWSVRLREAKHIEASLMKERDV
jgi:hypothetical protein